MIGDVGIEYWQTQVALTVAYQVDTWSLWAGPFLQFIEGDLELDGQLVLDDVIGGNITVLDADIEESSQVGAPCRRRTGTWRNSGTCGSKARSPATRGLSESAPLFTPESFGL